MKEWFVERRDFSMLQTRAIVRKAYVLTLLGDLTILKEAGTFKSLPIAVTL